MKAYKIIVDDFYGVQALRRIIVPSVDVEGYFNIAATPLLPTHLSWTINLGTIRQGLERGWLVEVDLVNERWVHPHLLKPIRIKLLEESLEA
jgi:hypothetical protein